MLSTGCTPPALIHLPADILLFNFSEFPVGSTDPTIIYTLTRRDTEDLANALQPVFKDRIAMYHGGMSTPQRSAVHHRFINDELEVGLHLSASSVGAQ